MQSWVLKAIRLYQAALSPYVGGKCRHIPTCSQYAYEAISKHGFLKGAWLGALRLGKCWPVVGTSGYDPVP